MGTFFGADTGFKICPQTGFGANSESKSSDSESDCLDSPHLWWLMGAEQRWQRIRSGPGYPRFFADPVSRRSGYGTDPDLNLSLPQEIIWRQNRHYISRRP